MFLKNKYLLLGQSVGPSDMSDGSSTHGYPDFPPSPDSWLGDGGHRY